MAANEKIVFEKSDKESLQIFCCSKIITEIAASHIVSEINVSVFYTEIHDGCKK